MNLPLETPINDNPLSKREVIKSILHLLLDNESQDTNRELYDILGMPHYISLLQVDWDTYLDELSDDIDDLLTDLSHMLDRLAPRRFSFYQHPQQGWGFWKIVTPEWVTSLEESLVYTFNWTITEKNEQHTVLEDKDHLLELTLDADGWSVTDDFGHEWDSYWEVSKNASPTIEAWNLDDIMESLK